MGKDEEEEQEQQQEKTGGSMHVLLVILHCQHLFHTYYLRRLRPEVDGMEAEGGECITMSLGTCPCA